MELVRMAVITIHDIGKDISGAGCLGITTVL